MSQLISKKRCADKAHRLLEESLRGAVGTIDLSTTQAYSNRRSGNTARSGKATTQSARAWCIPHTIHNPCRSCQRLQRFTLTDNDKLLWLFCGSEMHSKFYV